MSQITKQFPTLSEITPNISVEVFVMGKFEYVINTDVQLTNIRLWAVTNDMTEHVVFVFNGTEILMNKRGDLSSWPVGMFDQILKGSGLIFHANMNNITPTHYAI